MVLEVASCRAHPRTHRPRPRPSTPGHPRDGPATAAPREPVGRVVADADAALPADADASTEPSTAVAALPAVADDALPATAEHVVETAARGVSARAAADGRAAAAARAARRRIRVDPAAAAPRRGRRRAAVHAAAARLAAARRTSAVSRPRGFVQKGSRRRRGAGAGSSVATRRLSVPRRSADAGRPEDRRPRFTYPTGRGDAAGRDVAIPSQRRRGGATWLFLRAGRPSSDRGALSPARHRRDV